MKSIRFTLLTLMILIMDLAILLGAGRMIDSSGILGGLALTLVEILLTIILGFFTLMLVLAIRPRPARVGEAGASFEVSRGVVEGESSPGSGRE